MKTFAIALVAAFLIAGQIFTPAAAAPAPAGLASGNCGDTYTVQYTDYLARIAGYCGTTVINILTLNPQIFNPNLVYAGQVLRLTSSAPITYWPTYNYNSYYTNTGYARVSLSATRAQAGDEVTVYASGFPANSEIDYRVGVRGEDYSVVYDGTVGSAGTSSQTITIPSDANVGEYWVVEVITTSLANEVKVYSPSIYIGAYYTYTTYTGYARVSVSATQADVGDEVTVSVSGFPANCEIDYRLGVKGENFSVVYDGAVGSNGSTSQTITIPSGADTGEYWVVQVITTSLKDITQVYSHTIYITD